MSKEAVRKEIARFLASAEPEVLCISGRWGVGKTYNWNAEIFPDSDKQAANAMRVKLRRYGYVSLFGVNSLAALRQSIFESSFSLGAEPNNPAANVAKRTKELAEVTVRRTAKIVSQLPYLTQFVGDIGETWYLLVRNQIVCFDDLERRGANLAIRDVLGLASNLKEERRCKVVLILNDEEIGEESEKAEYKALLEKVVDVRIRFDLTPEESIAIAAGGAVAPDTWIAEDALKLGLSNIRVIKKISNAYSRVFSVIAEFDEEVRRYVVHALAILAYAVYMPNGDKLLALMDRDDLQRLFEEGEKRQYTDQENELLGMMNVYGFSHLDEFDEQLLKGIRDGYFDEPLVKKRARDMHESVLRNRRKATFSAVWQKHFREAFDGDEGEILTLMIDAMKGSIDTVSIGDLNAVVAFAKYLERPDIAKEAIEIFVSGKRETPEIFNLKKYMFAGDITEGEIKERFVIEAGKHEDMRPLGDVLTHLSKRDGWSPEDLEMLAAAKPEDYRDVFLKAPGDMKQPLIYTALQFGRIVNATDQMNEITERAKNGLRLIAETSRLNRRRISTLYDIDIKDEVEKATIRSAEASPKAE